MGHLWQADGLPNRFLRNFFQLCGEQMGVQIGRDTIHVRSQDYLHEPIQQKNNISNVVECFPMKFMFKLMKYLHTSEWVLVADLLDLCLSQNFLFQNICTT